MAADYQVALQTIHIGGSDFEIRSLQDRQQYSDPDDIAKKAGVSAAAWPLFGVIWPSGIMLADVMNDYPMQGLRILEVGCGLGLPSLIAHHRGADITASDYHPLAEEFMEKNATLNHLSPVRFQIINWNRIDASLGKFNLIIGSDILYEPDHPRILCRFIERHAEDNCTIIMVDPGRRQRMEFSKRMIDNGFALIPHLVNAVLAASMDFKGKVLVYTR